MRVVGGRRQRRLHRVRPQGHRLAEVLLPRAVEVEQRRARLLRGHRSIDDPAAVPLEGKVQAARQGQAHPLLDQDAAGSLHRAPQGVRIARARGHDSQQEEAGLRVEAIGEPQHGRLGGGRDRVVGAARQVVPVDCVRQALRQPVGPRVEPADDPLQLGELLHHLRGEVVLAQRRGAGHHLRVDRLAGGRERRVDRFRQPRLTTDLRGVRTQLLVKGDPLEPGDPAAERRPPVVLPEEARVREPRPQDPLVSLADGPGAVALAVGDGQETVQQPARSVDQGEVLLVVPHGGDQDLARQVQEGGLELPGNHQRPLDQVGDLLEQIGIDVPGVARGRAEGRGETGARRPGGGAQAFGDHPPPLPDVRQHVVGPQRLQVGAGILQGHARLAGETVAEGVPSRAHPGEGQVDDLAVEQRHHRVHRADEAMLPAPPAHCLGEGQGRHQGRDHLRQHLPGRAAADLTQHGHAFSARRRDPPQILQSDPLGPGEPHGGLGGPAFGVVGGPRGRPGHLHCAVGLARSQAGHADRQAARGGEGLDVPLMGEPVRRR